MMTPTDIVWRVFLVSQMCVGVLGNTVFFGLRMFFFLIQPHLRKPIDSIFTNLTLINILNIIFPLLPHVASAFGVRQFLDDVGCQALLFSYRVTRGLSIFTTSLLSAFQAVTISPGNSKWAWLKQKLSTQTLPSFLFICIINMLIYIPIIETVRAFGNFSYDGPAYSHPYCQATKITDMNPDAVISVIVIYDLVFVVLMICSSLYMVNFLYRHHRRAQRVRSRRLSSQASPEHKATRTILLLVGCFVFFHCSNNLVILYSYYIQEKIPKLEVMAAFLSSCYPTFFPFLLLRNDKIVSQFTSTLSLTRITCSQRESHG